MIKIPNKKRMRAESEIELFLRLFPLLAAHFELKSDLNSSGLAALLGEASKILAEEYEDALDNELQSNKKFVEKLPSVIRVPKIKKPIIESD